MAARETLNTLRKRQVAARHDIEHELPLPYFNEYGTPSHARLDLSYGIIVLTQKLTPLSRAVFILRNAFDLSFSEIAEAFERTPAACRQAYDRGKKKMEAADNSKAGTPISSAQISKLSAMIIAGDITAITSLLAKDVVFHGDGGGVAPDLGGPVTGAIRIAQFLSVAPDLLEVGASYRVIESAQGALLLAEKNKKLLLLVTGEVSAEGISTLFAISDPVKLQRFTGLLTNK